MIKSDSFMNQLAIGVPDRPSTPAKGYIRESDIIALAESAGFELAAKSDIVIDMIGFRRYGHSEIDDPTLTSPTLYRQIDETPLLWQSYAERIGIAEERYRILRLLTLGDLTTFPRVARCSLMDLHLRQRI